LLYTFAARKKSKGPLFSFVKLSVLRG
jgi:hypothetical protein